MADAKKTEEKEVKNPFIESVSYAEILKEIPEGSSVKDHYKNVLSENEISILESELKYYKSSLVKPKEVKEEKDEKETTKK